MSQLSIEAIALRNIIDNAKNFLADNAYTDGAHHKQWTIDQAIRSLTGSPVDERLGYPDYTKKPTEEYEALVKEHTKENFKADNDVFEECDWDSYYEYHLDDEGFAWSVGIAP